MMPSLDTNPQREMAASRNEVKRIIDALRTSIRLSGVSHRQIERELSMSTGYLTRILAGQVQLKLFHVVAICNIIRCPLGDFFTALFRPTAAPTRLSRGLAQLHAAPGQSSDLTSLFQSLHDGLDQLEASMKSTE